MSDEKRRFSRISFNVLAEMTIENNVYSTEEIANLSVGGCLFPVSDELEKGAACRIVIRLSGTGSEVEVQVDGEIVRCDPGLAAIKFIRIDPDSLFHLQNIIRYNAPDPDEVEKEIIEHPGLV